MTGALDSRMRAVAGSLVDRLGKAVTFTAPASSYDPTTGAATGGGTNYAWVAAVTDYATAFGVRDVTATDRMVLIAPAQSAAGVAAGFTPLPGWKVTVGSEVLVAEKVTPVYSGELVAAWMVEVR